MFHVCSVVVTKRNKTLLERLQGQPRPSWPREGDRSCATSPCQLCSFDLIFARALMGASEIPLFLLFLFAVKAVVNVCPALYSLLCVCFFWHSHVLRNAFEVVFVSQRFFKLINSFDVQENMKSASPLAAFCGKVWKAAKELKTRVEKPLSSVLWF